MFILHIMWIRLLIISKNKLDIINKKKDKLNYVFRNYNYKKNIQYSKIHHLITFRKLNLKINNPIIKIKNKSNK